MFQIFQSTERQAVIWTALSAFGIDISFTAASRLHKNTETRQSHFIQLQDTTESYYHFLVSWKRTVGENNY